MIDDSGRSTHAQAAAESGGASRSGGLGAAAGLRDAPEPGWEALREKVGDSVARVGRQGVAVRSDDARVWISDRVLRKAVAEQIEREIGARVSHVRFLVDSGVLVGVIVEAVARYGDELRESAERMRATVASVVADLLRLSESGELGRNTDVTWTDLEEALS